MPWLFLLAAGLLEIGWAYAMKRSEGFTLLGPSLVTVATMAASFALLALAMRSLPLGTAYAVWTGIGTLGAFLVGAILLGEAVTPLRLFAVLLVLSGVALLKLSAGH